MTHGIWYPAAAVSAVVLGCGGSAENGNRASTGGTTSIDTGVPMHTGGMPQVYYGFYTGGAYTYTTGGAYTYTTGGSSAYSGGGGAYSVGGVGGGTSFEGICTPGADQTCNDNATASTIVGHCEADGSCSCGNNYFVWASGKCKSQEEASCYSPTQNIDKAYVDRAFGCNCNSTTSTSYCGIDSSGLLVYMACKNGKWQSGNTGFCTDPPTCFSPTQNVVHALEPGAVGCTCDPSTYQGICFAIETDGEVVAVDSGIFESDAGNIPQTIMIACTSSSSGKWIAYNGAAMGCR